MIKVLHTADVHLGRRFVGLEGKAAEYRAHLLRTFVRIAELAELEKVALLLVAGDLFDTNRLHGVTIERVISVFRKLDSARIRVGIVPGVNDAYGEDSIYQSMRFPPNVTVFSPERPRYIFDDLGLTVHAPAPGEGLAGLAPEERARWNIGLAHTALQAPGGAGGETTGISENDIAGSGLDYLALGSRHNFQDCSRGETRAGYSGSPEPLEAGSSTGSVALVTLRGKGSVEVRQVRVGTRQWEAVTVDVSEHESPGDVSKLIEARADPNLILEITLTGQAGLDFHLDCPEIARALSREFFHLRLLDQTHPRLDEPKEAAFPEKTVTGRFHRTAGERIAAAGSGEEKELYEAVLKLGFALLRGRPRALE
ncbi:MAG: DNA repair exonuclease [Chloroflexi bacterium]|nr:DNA repair exonuclease [Chloroflexota bacterium]